MDKGPIVLDIRCKLGVFGTFNDLIKLFYIGSNIHAFVADQNLDREGKGVKKRGIGKNSCILLALRKEREIACRNLDDHAGVSAFQNHNAVDKISDFGKFLRRSMYFLGSHILFPSLTISD